MNYLNLKMFYITSSVYEKKDSTSYKKSAQNP